MKIFKNESDKRHQKRELPSLVSVLGIGFPSQIPLDYLHSVLLGATKKILKKLFYSNGPRNRPILQQNYSTAVTNSLQKINAFIPSEIHRSCRPIHEIATFKGNELRVFSLKVGPVALKYNVPNEIYNNFMLLYAAITILCDPDLCLLKNETAKALIDEFLESSEEVYGKEFLVSVVHSLIHLPGIVMQQRAPLDEFSAFPFECFMTPIKNCLHSGKNSLEQFHRRMIEIENADQGHSRTEPNKIITGRKISPEEIASLNIYGVTVSSLNKRDQFLLSKQGNVLQCQKISIKDNILTFRCQELVKHGEFFEFPIKASKLNYFWCTTNCFAVEKDFLLEDLSRKLFGMPFEDSTLVFALLRKFENHCELFILTFLIFPDDLKLIILDKTNKRITQNKKVFQPVFTARFYGPIIIFKFF